MECYSTLSMKELMDATTWMNLKGVMLSKINQTQKGKNYITPIYMSYLEQTNSQRKLKRGYHGLRRGEWSYYSIGTQGLYGALIEEVWKWVVEMVAQHCGYTEWCRTVRLKRVKR